LDNGKYAKSFKGLDMFGLREIRKNRKYRKALRRSGLFDAKYYLKLHRDARLSTQTPFEHFFKVGLEENRRANVNFDPVWYRKYYEDVKEKGTFPLIHFILFGIKENRFMNEEEKNKYEEFVSLYKFDIKFYKNSHEDLKIQDNDFDYVLHYVRYGKKEGRVAKIKLKKEDKVAEIKNKKEDVSSKCKFKLMSKDNDILFDEEYYLMLNPDVKKSALSPYEHYMKKGWKEDRTSPSYKFDMKKYLDVYQDVKNNNLNPIEHYQNRGKEEGRHLFLSDAYLDLVNGEKRLTALAYKDYKKRRSYVKNVIYTFNFNPEKKLLNPKVINEEYDYIYFGLPGSDHNSETIWEYRPSEFLIEDISLMVSFYCYNINILLPEYDNKVWIIDSEYLNTNNLNAIYSYMENDKANLFVFGQSDTKEVSLLKSIFNDKDLMIDEFSSKYVLEDTSQYEIIKPNCLILKKNSSDTDKILSVWWRANIKYGLDFFLPRNVIEYQSGYVINENTLALKTLSSLEEINYVSTLKNFYKSLITQKLDITKYNDQFKCTKVSVIVPVFNALEDVKECLYAIETSTYENYELVIADDCSKLDVKKWLEEYSKDKKHIRLSLASKNQGYTVNVNNAIKQTKADYVILLNSDTKVFGNWIEKLLIPFYSDNTVGISGALSNAAGWQSVPYLRADNTLPAHMDIEKVNKYLEESSSHPYYPMSDIINGFCMCIKQKTIDTIGLFDEKAFPRGYGEEDDFCMRARNNGFKNVVVTSTYVHHSKSKSFGHETRVKLATASRKILDEKYGKEGYKLVTESIGKNPAINAKREKIQEFFSLYTSQYSTLNEKIVQIETQEYTYPKINPKICVHLHLHYVDMAKYFAAYLNMMPYKFDLYLTVNEDMNFKVLAKHFKTTKNIKQIKYSIYDNRGRDVFPFIDTIKKVYNDYEYVLHIHSKKSVHNSMLGNKWLSHLMSDLMYGKTYIKNLLYIMQKENVGLLFPPVIEELHPNYKWGGNKPLVKSLLEKIGVDISNFDNEKLIFSAGNMFWANTKALKKLFDYKFEITDFPVEPIPIDGTLAHALERSLDFIVKDAGYTTLVAEPNKKIEFKNELEMFKNRMLSYEDIEKTILQKLKAKEPFSLLRFYDGEGAFYKHDIWSDKFLQERMNYYFGKEIYTKDDAKYINDLIISSLNTADIVGIPNLDIVEEMLEFTNVYANNDIERLPYIQRRYNKSIDCNSAWRILSSFELVLNALNTDKDFCTKDIHYDMVLTGMIYRILNEVSEVSIISSQPVAEYLEKLFKIKVHQYVVPTRAIDNETLESTKHYPNAFKEISAQLENNNIEGQLFLVGAGPLGKVYCKKIKEQGGVALDIGAIFDSWINFHTRPEHVDKNNSFNSRLLLTSQNIISLTHGKVKPIGNVDETSLPKKKINKYLK